MERSTCSSTAAAATTAATTATATTTTRLGCVMNSLSNDQIPDGVVLPSVSCLYQAMGSVQRASLRQGTRLH
jgi:hypothetical protein